MLIKLYSKSIDKDEGSKVEVNIGSFGDIKTSGHHSDNLNDDWSYFSYISLEDKKREKHYSHGGDEISRDNKVAHLYSSLKNENHTFVLDAIRSSRDAFIGTSMDASAIDTTLDIENIHLGYDGTFNNFSVLLNYAYLSTDSQFEDDVTPINSAPMNGMFPIFSRQVETKSSIYTAELKHKLQLQNNRLVTGIKYRYKKYSINDYYINDIYLPHIGNDSQAITTLFVEDQYSFLNNLILTAGVQYININNKDATFNEQDNFLNYRLGLTYINNNWVLKTIASRTESYLEPYLVDSVLIASGEIDNHISNNIYQNIIYQHKENKYELVFGFKKEENKLITSTRQLSQLEPSSADIKLYETQFRYERDYNDYDKLFIDLSYKKVTNIPVGDKSKHNYYKALLKSINTYNKFDIFNEVIYDRNNIVQENFFNYNAGVIYNYTQDLTFSLKGENILGKANESSYLMLDNTTLQKEDNLNISPFDQKLTLSMEYLF